MYNVVLALIFPCSVDDFPRWSKLAHFKNLLNVDFGDGNKWEDIAKVIQISDVFNSSP